MFSLLPYFSGPGFIPQARVYRLIKKKLDNHLQQCRCKDCNSQKHIDALLVLYKCLFIFWGLGGFEVHWEVAQKICSSCWQLREREGWLVVSELSILNHEGNGEHSGEILEKFFLCVWKQVWVQISGNVNEEVLKRKGDRQEVWSSTGSRMM